VVEQGSENPCVGGSTPPLPNTQVSKRQGLTSGVSEAAEASGSAVSILAVSVPGKQGKIDPDLAAVIRAWPDLPDALKQGVLAIVRSAVK
jgi:UDP-N-acetyl-D-mannosaminuronate dehydrogenase